MRALVLSITIFFECPFESFHALKHPLESSTRSYPSVPRISLLVPFHTGIATLVDKFTKVNVIISSRLLQYGQTCLAVAIEIHECSSRQTRRVRFRVIGHSLLEEVGLALQGNLDIQEVEWPREYIFYGRCRSLRTEVAMGVGRIPLHDNVKQCAAKLHRNTVPSKIQRQVSVESSFS